MRLSMCGLPLHGQGMYKYMQERQYVKYSCL